jgi:transcriptional regulator of heat shock response
MWSPFKKIHNKLDLICANVLVLKKQTYEQEELKVKQDYLIFVLSMCSKLLVEHAPVSELDELEQLARKALSKTPKQYKQFREKIVKTFQYISLFAPPELNSLNITKKDVKEWEEAQDVARFTTALNIETEEQATGETAELNKQLYGIMFGDSPENPQGKELIIDEHGFDQFGNFHNQDNWVDRKHKEKEGDN